MSGLVAGSAYRRFVSDLRRDGIIPALPYPELVALEAERRRLVAALEEAEQGGGHVDEAGYVAARSKALLDGTPLPPTPQTAAEQQANAEQRRRNVAAAEEALMRLGDAICSTVAAHPEWLDAAEADAQAARDEAERLRVAAKAADDEAERRAFMVRYLARVAADELHYPTFTTPEPLPEWLHIDTSDPRLAGLIADSRSGSPL